MTAAQKHAGGRPSLYNDQLAAQICGGLALGKSLNTLCQEIDVGVSTVYLWLRQKPEFLELYVQAREDQADTLADEILDIADEDPAVVLEKARDGSEDTTIRVDSAAVNHQRLRVDSRKWIASKLKPKKYGDRIQQEHSGNVGVVTDPIAAMDQLVTLATANPTMGPMIRDWAEQLLQRLPKIAE